MLFISITLIAIIYTIAFGIYNNIAFLNTKKYFNYIALKAFVISIFMGLFQGTAYTHVINFYWWMFSLLTFILILFTALILTFTMRVISSLKKNKTT